MSALVDLAGRSSVSPDPRFWNQIGPFGGWLAARLMQAMRRTVDPAFTPRSIALTFHGALANDDIDIDVRPLPPRRTVAAVQGALVQDGEPRVSAQAVFGRPRSGPDWTGPSPRPDASGPEAVAPFTRLDRLAAFVRQFEYRIVEGGPFCSAGQAQSGGWLRLREPADVMGPEDLLLLADAWYPPVWATLAAPAPVSTLAMNVVFHRWSVPRALTADGFIRVRHCTERVSEGYAEEHGELRLPSGELIAQTQQLTWIDLSKPHGTGA